MRVRTFFLKSTFWWQIGWDYEKPCLWIYLGPWTFQITRG